MFFWIIGFIIKFVLFGVFGVIVFMIGKYGVVLFK